MIHFKNLLTINLKEEFENNKDKVNPKTPREHQTKAHKEMNKFFLQDQKNAGILVLPTGGGKTYTSIYWLLKNIISKNKKVLWLADQGFLLEQARETFKENILEVDTKRRNEINIRVVSGSDKHANPNQIAVSDDILLITSQTAISNWTDDNDTKFKKFINENAKDGNLFIVYDEAHHTPAFGRRNLLIGGSEGKTGIIEKFPQTQLLGLTATPTYTDKRQRGWLWEIFKDGIIYEISKKELEDKKILASPVFIQEKTNFNLVLSDNDVDKLIFKHQELPSHIIEEIAKNEDRNNFIAQYYYDNREQFGKTIIFLDRWYQCKTVENYINKKAGKEIASSVFSYIDGNKNIDYINNRKSNQNEINLDRFKKGEIEVLINVKMLTEGVDVPDVKTVFLTRDTNSSILFTQMVGRALRGEGAGGNKTTASIVMFSDNWNRHIQFASNRFIGGKEDTATKERGFRPFELIRIDLLDKLELEYQNQDYEKSVFDLIPIGWYVVAYTDTIEEEDENNEIQKIAQGFIENVVVLEQEEFIFRKYIQDYSTFHQNILWEQEELDLENAEIIINKFLNQNNFVPNKATTSKLIQIARHLGQNNSEPEYFTFEQKSAINLMKYVLTVRENNYGRDQTEEYLEFEYLKTENPFLKVLFPTYEDFYRAYEYEDNVYRKMRKAKATISEASQDVTIKRLASEEVRNIVLSRDGHKCLCCGKTNNLQIDHIISFKEEEPDNDNPELYQTLCGVCNREKSSNSFNYRITNYDTSKMAVENVLTTSSNTEDPIFYFTRLINCYYKTSAVQAKSVQAKNNGNSIWKAFIKLGIDPEETILKHKDEILNIILAKGYRLKNIEIIAK
ncbi:DEAD/DEAH box helicase family protein [Empedobacter falsenii]|uniref:DEAD/DEAH box helicase family protein n=1 Tax=Empedobacter falsenii TaxID=343874 RepID=A0ABY8V9P3_9FLAO|nr:DEAD/DEAH box helicase family protein [Empedobacter falsenii]WIH98346.1 DEAD/DEAH box helicase family protein [Empedobacter falsenii]